MPGDIPRSFDVDVAELAGMEREHLTAEFHCVAGWSYRGLHWDGVRFGTFYDEVIAPRQTRRKLIAALEMTRGKRDRNPPRKHGNIPL